MLDRFSYGKITLARCLIDEKFYILKIFKKSRLAKEISNLKREWKIMKTFKHAFLLELKYTYKTDKTLNMVIEFCEGGDLLNVTREKKKLTEKEAKFYMFQLLIALRELHGKQIIFNNVKTENIVIDRYGYIKLKDFSLARMAAENTDEEDYFRGTLQYISPELIKGQKSKFEYDVWCMGIVFYELLFGVFS